MIDNVTKEDVISNLWFDINKCVYIDIETGNTQKLRGELDPWADDVCIALVQTCIDGKITLHDWNEETRLFLLDYVEKGYTFVGHNLEFEITWLHVHGNIRLTNVVDTMLLSQVLNAGKRLPDEGTRVALKSEGVNIDHVGKYDLLLEEDEENIENTRKAGVISHGLGATAYRYARAKLKKDSATSNWLRRPLTEEQVRYAEDDVRYLELMMKNELYYGYVHGMYRVMELECKVLPALSAMRARGVMLSREAWEDAANENKRIADELKERLDVLYGNEMGERDVSIGEEFNFFGPVQMKFNVGSDTQIKEFYSIEKADEAHLSQVIHPLIKDTLKFKEYKKLASTYGEGYLQFLSKDGRIHSPLKQAFTTTGRLSSAKPNMQNIPPDILKMFLRALKGYILMTADYSSVESRILAYDSKDDVFIQTVNSKDFHWETAKKIFHLPDDAPVDAEKRRFTKQVNFGIPYGISPAGLFNRGVGETKEEALEIITSWFSAFPRVKAYLQQCVQEATVRGFTQDRFGRIRWYEIPSVTEVDDETYKKAIAGAARQGQNMKIQALSASITKQAIYDCWKYLEETQYGFCVLTVHDSIFFELKEEYAHISAPALRKIMEDAGPKIVPGISTPVDFDLGTVEKRKCKVSGLEFKVYSHLYDTSTSTILPNPETLAPETIRALKSLRIPVSDDYMGMFEAITKILPTRENNWREANSKFVASIEKTYALHHA